MFRLFVTLCIFGGTLCAADALNNDKSCRIVEGVKDFNLTRFSGFWYIVQVNEDYIDDAKLPFSTCTIFDIVVEKNNAFTLVSPWSAGPSYIQDKLNPSKYHANVADYNEQEFTILATDYRSYAIAYECFSESNPYSRATRTTIMVFASTHEPLTLEFSQMIKSVLAKNNLGQRKLTSLDLKLCEGIQMVGRGKNEFRDPTAHVERAMCRGGRRDDGVKDFDRNRFMGSWYEIQSNIQGKTNSGPSNFNLVENNTRLHISNSSGYNNGYYKLNKEYPASFLRYIPYRTVIFSIYYTVLETDYDSYAICYACQTSLDPIEIIILTRNNELTGDIRTKIDEALLKKDYGITYLFRNSESNCKKD